MLRLLLLAALEGLQHEVRGAQAALLRLAKLRDRLHLLNAKAGELGALRARAGQASSRGGAWHHAGGRRGTTWLLPAISCTATASRHTRQRGAPCALPAETGGEHANAAAQGSRQCHGSAVAANPLCSAQPARSRW